MAAIPSLANPGKEHPLYGKYTKTATVNKIVKLATLAVVIIYLITVFFTPVFTASTTVKNANEEIVYEKSVSYTLSEILDEQERFNDEEKYFENVEEGVAYLRDKDFSELERIKNLEKAADKIDAYLSSSEFFNDEIEDMSENRPLEYIALAEKANAIEGYTTNKDGERIPVISWQGVAAYLRNQEKNKIGVLVKVFSQELEARNTDGLREFLYEAEQLGIVYNTEYATAIKSLGDKYLVAEYDFDKDMCETVANIASINKFIPDSAMTKSVAEAIDLYSDMAGFAFSSYAAGNAEKYEANYIYFEYDLEADEIVFKQHSAINSLNKALTIMKWGVIIAVIAVVAAMLPTAIGLITRKHKKLKSLSVLYAGFPILGMMIAFTACAISGVAWSDSAVLTEVVCDLGSIIPSAFIVALIVVAAAIATKVLVTVYTSKYNKWLKQTQASAKAAAEEASAAEPVAEEAPAQEENTEDGN